MKTQHLPVTLEIRSGHSSAPSWHHTLSSPSTLISPEPEVATALS